MIQGFVNGGSNGLEFCYYDNNRWAAAKTCTSVECSKSLKVVRIRDMKNVYAVGRRTANAKWQGQMWALMLWNGSSG